jgi:hypothetical protein
LLSPISAETLSLTIADWQNWERWYLSFKNGQIATDTEPCFPLERELHLTLQRQLTTRLVLDEHAMFAATAAFLYNLYGGSDKPRIVAEWTVVPYDRSRVKRATYEWSNDDATGSCPNKAIGPHGESRNA